MKGESLPIIACSLSGEELGARREEFRGLLTEALTAAEPIEGGLRLRFGPGVGARVRELARKEKECCSFGFEITDDDTGTTLVVTAPPEAQSLLDEMLAGRSL